MSPLIIGGSLTGLTFALACASKGIRTRVYEKTPCQRRSGAALGVDRRLLLRAIGANPDRECDVKNFPVTTSYRQAVSWQALHDWLRDQARQRPEVTLIDGVAISSVVQDQDQTTAISSGGQRINAHVVVGADGYRSLVRGEVDPDQSTANYAGYLLWRGLISESDLPRSTSWPEGDEGTALVTKTGFRLVAYTVAGLNGSLRPGQRLISFTWYDSGRDSLLRDLHCLSATNQVLSSITSEDVPLQVCAELRDLAFKIWPNPWRAAIVCALDRGDVFATPVAEYHPRRLCRGRLALIGDAAHVVSPVTGKGFAAGIEDALVLATSLVAAFGRSNPDIPQALKSYEDDRLPEAQTLVRASNEWSRTFLRGAKTPVGKSVGKKR